MKIVLQSKMIVLQVDHRADYFSWISNFILDYSGDLLYLPKAILMFHDPKKSSLRQNFLERACKYFARSHEISYSFYLRSILRQGTVPIKVELTKMHSSSTMSRIKLQATATGRVGITLGRQNRLLVAFLRTELEPYVSAWHSSGLVLNVHDIDAKEKLKKLFTRKWVLYYRLRFVYDEDFLDTLDGRTHQKERRKRNVKNTISEGIGKYYRVLELSTNATPDAIRRSYKKLAKRYHPDRVFTHDAHTVSQYTQRFQMLQEAYSVLMENRQAG